jgi:hypothetical protein
MYHLTSKGYKEIQSYINEMIAKRKEILDAGKDTAEETSVPTVEEVFEDLLSFPIDEDGEIWNSFGVTDNYSADRPLVLALERDFSVNNFKITHIEWDIDEIDGIQLPSEVEIPHMVIQGARDMDELRERVGDWLSDEYGFCFNGFKLEDIQKDIEEHKKYFVESFYNYNTKEPVNATYIGKSTADIIDRDGDNRVGSADAYWLNCYSNLAEAIENANYWATAITYADDFSLEEKNEILKTVNRLIGDEEYCKHFRKEPQAPVAFEDLFENIETNEELKEEDEINYEPELD